MPTVQRYAKFVVDIQLINLTERQKVNVIQLENCRARQIFLSLIIPKTLVNAELLASNVSELSIDTFEP